jgi:V8-like Glu-specific endopeptidase
MLKNRLFKSTHAFLPLSLGVGLTFLPVYSSCKPKMSTSELEMFGGKKDNGKFTSTIAILRQLNESDWIVTCTATKIAKNMVLTAAHCVLPENGPVDGKMFRSWYEPGTLQRIATGQNANTGVKQERKIKSVALYPGLKEKFEKCSSDCIASLIRYSAPSNELSPGFPDMAVITYENEIADSTVSEIATFEGASTLFASGYGVNLSQSEFKKQKIEPGIAGDKRFFEFVPKPYAKIVSELKASIAPLSVEGINEDELDIRSKNELNIFAQLRTPVTHSVLSTIRSTKDEQSVEKEMPPLKLGAYTMKGDSGGGIYKFDNNRSVVVGVHAGSTKENDDLPTAYFSYSTGITKNPRRNTYDWIKKLIRENETKIPVPAKK